jgi:hypothetical protein
MGDRRWLSVAHLSHRLSSPAAGEPDGLALTEASLGFYHPLCQAERDVRSARRQLLGTTAFLAALCALVERPVVGLIVGIGIVVLAVVLLRLVILDVVRRDRVVEAIAGGHESVPLHGVRRRRERLLDARSRCQLASSLEGQLIYAARLPLPGSVPRPVVTAAGAEVEQVVRLLRGDMPRSARGVALCERLLADGPCSPLYGSDADALLRELGRIRYLLDGDAST